MNVFTEFWSEIAARPGGPLAIRFYVQPIMAAIFAIRDGRRDAAEHKPAYLWSLFTEPEHRRERLRSGWQSIGKIFLFSVALDLVYQIIVLKGVRPVQGLVIAVLLALVPYVLLRGPINRLASRVRSSHAANSPMVKMQKPVRPIHGSRPGSPRRKSR